ncbi:colanic acid biosynthesis pyruvyl transferase WcaK [Vibrio parahaemolyticus]|uniref:colanic acid biosynthesis pyruvyl transferase WcaK n=2 Tax=Vibrio parahaemolyticus TaxID=670 RepID=UPI0027E3E462|nr:colanic acid biosynthesis pyruvyl transferase WcaK [Vibrio parahaemolyticus]WMN63450.1 colanic acid biosynthesis pyruvyl transferase WcaK [Vibrio parahaemolyticus]WMN74086.1 colanic acid biosynthesis pyruvyl transferase WcaK [Vibrio parahaemolyticus]
MTKILIVGNHCCSNRGDAAILRGLIDFIEEEYPNFSVDITSRYVDGAKWFFNNTVHNDILAKEKDKYKSISGKIKNRLINNFLLPIYIKGGIDSKKFLPKSYENFSNFINKYDFVIQVGGSFFVDLYGVSQFEAAAVCIREKKPILMVGHSVGPFKNKNISKIAKDVFKNVDSLILRESVSEEHLYEIGLTHDNFILGGDTAWLINPDKYEFNISPLLSKYVDSRPTIAITVRELAPFDVRLGISQDDYEEKMANLCEYLIGKGYNIIAVSTCTGFDSYHRDDRISALRIGRIINNAERYTVVMDELTDVELGKLLSKCTLTIGTRLHSAILSMRFGTPAFAIYYEHKSLGILKKIGLIEYSVAIHDIATSDFKNIVLRKLENIEHEQEKLASQVHVEAENCKSVIREAFSNLLGKDNQYG